MICQPIFDNWLYITGVCGAFGTGFVIGIGRGGSMLAPIVAGFMFEAGVSLPTVAMIISSGSLIAITALWFLKLKPD